MRQSSPQLRSVQQRQVAAFLALAQLGYAHWFFGNLYEAVVRVPERLSKENPLGSDDPQQMALLSSGSPVRYFLPGVPVVIGATLSALLPGWKWRSERPWFVSLTLSTLFGFAVTAYLVRSVNFKLFFGRDSIEGSTQLSELQTTFEDDDKDENDYDRADTSLLAPRF
jgi:hypothetical protein